MSIVRTGWLWVVLGAVFARELMLSVKDVALAVFSPARVSRSAIVAIPLDVKSDAGIALLANMITLTPGTTSLHVSTDRRTLYAHVMHCPNPEQAVQQIKRGFEYRVRQVLS